MVTSGGEGNIWNRVKRSLYKTATNKGVLLFGIAIPFISIWLSIEGPFTMAFYYAFFGYGWIIYTLGVFSGLLINDNEP